MHSTPETGPSEHALPSMSQPISICQVTGRQQLDQLIYDTVTFDLRISFQKFFSSMFLQISKPIPSYHQWHDQHEMDLNLTIQEKDWVQEGITRNRTGMRRECRESRKEREAREIGWAWGWWGLRRPRKAQWHMDTACGARESLGHTEQKRCPV